MEALIITALDGVWSQICKPRELRTPDASTGRSFYESGSGVRLPRCQVD